MSRKSTIEASSMNTSIEDILRSVIADKYKVISFDVFDTLLRRNIALPDHVFVMMEAEVEQWPNCAAWSHQFVRARKLSSHFAIRQAHLSGREDCGIGEIYDVLCAMLPSMRPMRDRVLALELALESQLLHQYPLGKKLFEAARTSGKRVVLTSDMYLPKEFIAQILSREGYEDYELLLVSGDVGAVKGSYTLFDWLPLRMGVARSEILHIGDNVEIDGHTPGKRGIKSMLVPMSIRMSSNPAVQSALARHASLCSVATAHYLHRQADSKIHGSPEQEVDDVDFVAYSMMGPLLIGLSHWIAGKLRDGSLERVLFLARDGEIVSKAFSLLYPDLSEKTSYAFASRRMLYAAGRVSASEIFNHYAHLDRPDTLVSDFIDAVDGGTVTLGPKPNEFSASLKIGDPGARQRLHRFLDQSMQRQPHLNKDNIDRVKSYFGSQIGSAKKVGLFDLGWRGNLQRSIMALMDGLGVDFEGLYFGYIFEDQVVKSTLPIDAFAFSMNFPQEVFNDIGPCIGLLEILFAGTHPSIIDVRREGGVWYPVYEKSAPEVQATISGAERVHQAALRFVQDYKQIYPEGLFSNRRMIVDAIREFMCHPSKSDAGVFANLSWLANINSTEAKRMIEHPADSSRRAYKSAMKRSTWRAGFKAHYGSSPKWYRSALRSLSK